MTKPKYLIIAGVNGVGKSTLYTSEGSFFGNTKRINADEILKANHGDWHRDADNLHAMRQALKEIRNALKNHVSINTETTLAGNGKTQIELINLAHDEGYTVSLYYVGVANVETALARIKQRVAKGGHGVDETLVRKRYEQSLRNLPKIAKLVDNLYIYDNQKLFDLIYKNEHGIIQDKSYGIDWIKKINSISKLN